MQYIVDNCGVTELLSDVTLPSKTTVHSSGVEQPVLRAVQLPTSVVLPWLFPYTLFLCRWRGKSVCNDTEVCSGPWWGWTSWKAVPTTWKTLWANASDTAHAQNSSVYLCSWETGGGCRKRPGKEIAMDHTRHEAEEHPFCATSRKNCPCRSPSVYFCTFRPRYWAGTSLSALPLAPLFVYCIWSHSCSQCGQTRLAWGSLSQHVHQVR